jgi:hypothetical protein
MKGQKISDVIVLPLSGVPERDEIELVEIVIVQLAVNKEKVTCESVAEHTNLTIEVVKEKYQKRIEYLEMKYEYTPFLISEAKRRQISYQNLIPQIDICLMTKH